LNDKIERMGGVYGLFTRRLAFQTTPSTHMRGRPIYWLL